MIRYCSQKQLSLAEFDWPFQVALDEHNRWVKMSECIPWDELAEGYYQGLSTKQGRPAKDARLVIGAVIIKHKLCLSDQETVAQIQENPYLQYFVGLPGYQMEAPFSPSLFVEIRKRMGQEVFEVFHGAIIDSLESVKSKRKSNAQNLPQSGTVERSQEQDDNNDLPSDSRSTTGEPKVKYQGKLILDATVAPQAIRYPTDLSLLNEACEFSEQIIDKLYPKTGLNKKPRTYRQKARKAFVAIVKQRRLTARVRHRGIKQQLQYLRRNLGHIERLLEHWPIGTRLPLPRWLLYRYWVIQHVYEQQWEMYCNKSRRCDNRIVSISQPYVRPIIRGKQNKAVEFGSKLSVSLTDEGIAQVDYLRWDAFHEGGDLKSQVEAYHTRYGYYPEVILGDPVYGTRENRRYLKQHGIRFAGKPLGRPKKVTEANREELKQLKAQRREEYLQRIPIEGKFGQGKNGYRLNYIRAKRADTSEAWINSIFLVMNLLILLRIFFALGKRGAALVRLVLLQVEKLLLCHHQANQPAHYFRPAVVL
ncbi:IS5 family transposase [bacterium endosymbiont of Escarpia laminata]|nr:MAG: IS5 family transposase [bacterium endosymbiont of Escarpia laminata]